jgi:hypothetical protein
MIPKIIHQIWLGAPVPPEWAATAESWRRFHPGWEYRFWSDAESRPFVEANCPEFLGVYDSLSYPVQRSDVLRYLLLHRVGGVYADMDVECLRPIDSLLEKGGALVVMEPGAHAAERGIRPYLSNAFIASTPRHPMMGTLLQTLTEESTRAVTHRDVLETTGPNRFDRACRADGYPDVAVLDASTISPFARETPELSVMRENADGAERLRQFCKERGSFAIHYWANSWHALSGETLVNPEPFQVDGFIFFPRRDSFGHAIRHAGRNVQVLARTCLDCETAVAFNTDGFLKSRVLPMRQWDRWKDRSANEGLYVKKSVLRKPLWKLFGVGPRRRT